MKAINYFVLNILVLSVFAACKSPDQEQHDLYPETKAYFDIRNGSTFTFTDYSDTSVAIEYTSGNYNNNRANPDIENSEILFYDLNASGQPSFTMRCQSGGAEFKDQIALVTRVGDSTFIGPVIYNTSGRFGPGQNSGDSVIAYPTYNFHTTVFSDVLRVKLLNNLRYSEVYFAKRVGLIARREKSGKFYYVKSYNLK